MLSSFLYKLEKNTTIRTKLLMAFGVVLLGTLIIGGISIYGYQEMGKSTSYLYKKSISGVSEAKGLQTEIINLENELTNLMLASTISDKKLSEQIKADSSAKIAASIENIKGSIDTVSTDIDRAEVRETFFELVAVYNNYLLSVEQVLILEKSSPETAAKMYFGKEFQSLTPKIFALVKEYVRLELETAKINYENSYKVKESVTYVTISAIVISFILSFYIALYVRKSITSPLNNAKKCINDLAESRLNGNIDGLDYVGVTGQIASSVLVLQQNLRHAIKEISDNSIVISSSSEELAAVSAQLNSYAEESSSQAHAVANTSASVSQSTQVVASSAEEFSASIREISINAMEASNVANKAVQIASNTNSQMAKLRNSSVEIGAVLGVISGIAEQTNLLALNATIEAARAGELGKGFAVVANEVKELARSTAKATNEIGNSINTIQSDAKSAIESLEEITQIINKISDISNVIAAAVEEQAATVGEISRSIFASAAGSSEISQNIQGVADSSGKITQGSAEIQGSSVELARVSSQLRALVSRFEL
jgi:methyl-accepting chemotaxis protein